MRRVAEALRSAQRVTAFCHENPDADTLGAAIAISIAAERLGKPAEVVSGDTVPPFLAWMPRAEQVRPAPSLAPDLAVVVDSGEMSRIGLPYRANADWLARATVVNIDHHVSNPGYGAVAWVDPAAAATCEMVALLVTELGLVLDAELATVLLAGIVQDTHTFVHPNATPRTLRVAAGLVEAGADLAAINRAIYADKPFSTLALWGQMLGGVTQQAEGRIVHASMTQALLTATGEQPSAAEGFVDLLGITRLADIVLLFKEVGPGETRVSLRTSVRADAVAVAAEFGGGGHARASGCTLAVPIDRARTLVLAACERELARADARGH